MPILLRCVYHVSVHVFTFYVCYTPHKERGRSAGEKEARLPEGYKKAETCELGRLKNVLSFRQDESAAADILPFDQRQCHPSCDRNDDLFL
jgi:hypothetical protein